VFHARGLSILGQNVLFCSQRYQRSVHDVVNNPADSFINLLFYNSIDSEINVVANLVSELIMLRDKVLSLSNGISLSFDELVFIINYICLN
jgi:hypothetical protein